MKRRPEDISLAAQAIHLRVESLIERLLDDDIDSDTVSVVDELMDTQLRALELEAGSFGSPGYAEPDEPREKPVERAERGDAMT